MANRKEALRSLAVGDIFHAESPNGASLICLVLSVLETTIVARTITTQIHLEFDRQTGVALWSNEAIFCTIDATAPLPAEIRNVLAGIDRKFRFEQDPERLRLSETERQALLYVDSHTSANSL